MIDTQGTVRTLEEVLEVFPVWDQIFLKGQRDIAYPSADCLGDLGWLAVVEKYLDGATPEQLERAWCPDDVPENYVPRPLQRACILADLQEEIARAWRFRLSPDRYVQQTGGRQLDNDLERIDAYLWLLCDEEAVRERREIWSGVRALSWICERYGFASEVAR